MRRMKQFMALGLGVVLSVGAVMTAGASNLSEPSDATITMTADGDTEEPTGPVDPWNPDPDEILEPDPDGVDPDDEDEIKENKGRLRIDYVSNFKFPDTEINTVDQTVYAAVKTMNVTDANGDPAADKTLPNYAQISDFRGKGASGGWTLSAKISDFEYEDASSTKHVLNGAAVTLNNVYSSNAAGTVTGFEKSSTITLNANDTIIMSGEGIPSQGTNMAYFGEKDNLTTNEKSAGKSVALYIPADDGTTLAQTYKAKLTWTLKDTPTP